MSTIARQSLLLAWKDTRIFFRDRAALAFAFLLPFIFVIGFTLALRDVGPENEALRFILVTEDADFGFSYQAIPAIVEAGEGRIAGMNYEEAQAALDAGEIDGFVLFPAEFTPSLISGQATLEVIVGDGVAPADEAALRGFAQEIASRFSEGRATVNAVVALGNPERAGDVMRELMSNASGRRPLTCKWSRWGRSRRSTLRTSRCRAT